MKADLDAMRHERDGAMNTAAVATERFAEMKEELAGVRAELQKFKDAAELKAMLDDEFNDAGIPK